MPIPTQQFPYGRLRTLLIELTERAINTGALRPIDAREEIVDQDGVHFVIRRAENLTRKEEAKHRQLKPTAQSGQSSNPFLPYDENLFVCEVSDTHVALLNKFNVIDQHLLIITRAFEHQQSALTAADFEALTACLFEFESLGFYNSGTLAGASQPHKHLKLVPLPLSSRAPAVPIQSLLDASALPFRHALTCFDPASSRSPSSFAGACHREYLTMLSQLSIQTAEDKEVPRLSPAYNLLVTRKWMLLIPRSRECTDGISINALGFAGSFFVQSVQELDTIKALGPVGLLQRVTLER